MLGLFAVMGYGWYKVFHGQREKLELAREKMWSRIHITPLLQAEEDRDQVRRWYADQAREQQLLGTQTRSVIADKYVLLKQDMLVGMFRDSANWCTDLYGRRIHIHLG